MNPYYYLFYRLNRLLNRKGNNEWGPVMGLNMLLSLNIVVIYANVMQALGTGSTTWHKIPLGLIGAVVIIANMVLFLNKARVREIMERFQGESKTSARLGSLAVLLYALVSLALIFVV